MNGRRAVVRSPSILPVRLWSLVSVRQLERGEKQPENNIISECLERLNDGCNAMSISTFQFESPCRHLFYHRRYNPLHYGSNSQVEGDKYRVRSMTPNSLVGLGRDFGRSGR